MLASASPCMLFAAGMLQAYVALAQWHNRPAVSHLPRQARSDLQHRSLLPSKGGQCATSEGCLPRFVQTLTGRAPVRVSHPLHSVPHKDENVCFL